MKGSDFETTRAIARRSTAPRSGQERPYLVGVAGEHSGRFFPLEGRAEVYVGRGDDCEIVVVFDDIVSRRHCRVELGADGEFRLVDLNSTNGTLVNGREVSGAILRRGDRIFLGHSTILKFDFLADEERARWESASVDALTDFFNRSFFETRLEQMFQLARSRDRNLSLIMFDVDHFKKVNDEHTHQAGDFALHELASTVDGYLSRNRVDALACRLGGEEFVILLADCEIGAARGIAEGLRAAVADAAFEFEGALLRLTISLGCAAFVPGRHEAADQLVRAADDALFRAKREGRNRVAVAS
jgi:diguanylate cyclase (GGDEF)-like protein